MPVTKKLLKEIGDNYYRLFAVASASRIMYEEQIGDDYFENIEPYHDFKEKFKSNNLNTLLEIAVISLKDLEKHRGKQEGIVFIKEYGGNCNTRCYRMALVNAFID